MGCIGSTKRDELLEEIETLKESLSDSESDVMFFTKELNKKEQELQGLEDNGIKIVKYVGVRREGNNVYLALGCRETDGLYDPSLKECEGHQIKNWDGENRGVLSDLFPSAPLNKDDIDKLIDILIDCYNDMD